MIPIAKPYLTKEEAQAAYDTILTGWITQGPRVAELRAKDTFVCESRKHRCRLHWVKCSILCQRILSRFSKLCLAQSN